MSNILTTKPANSQFSVPNDTSILNSAMDALVDLPYGCTNGFCGTCKAKLLTGEIEYLDGYDPNILSESELKNGMIICCQATLKTDAQIEVAQPDKTIVAPQDFTAKIVGILPLNDRVISLKIKTNANNQIQYTAGQYVNFYLDSDKTRSFSIANRLDDSGILEFHIKHNNDGEFTNKLFNGEIKVGDIFNLNAPLGTFCIKNSQKSILLMATGTGFGPIKAMVEQLLADNSKRKITLYWGARTFADLYMHDLALKWVAENPKFSYVPVLSKPDDNWDGISGYVTDAVAKEYLDLSKYEVYIAGLPEMVKDSEKILLDLRVAKNNLFSDAFEIGE